MNLDKDAGFDRDRYEYFGWIPCVAGELFYENVNIQLGEYDYFVGHNITDDISELEQQILVSSVVDWQDTKLISKPDAGRFRMVVTARLDKNRVLKGKVYALEKFTKENFKKPWSHQLTTRPNVLDEIEIIRSMEVFCKSRDVNFFEDLEDRLQRVTDPVCHKADFIMNKHGMVLLKERGKVTEENRTIFRQAYYYLKNIFHTHAHHSPQAESLTTIHKTTRDSRADSERLITDLKRGINDKRTLAPKSSYSVSGIAVYGVSLVDSCCQSGWLADSDNGLMDVQKSYFTNVGRSIELKGTAYGTNVYTRTFHRTTQSLIWMLALIGPVLVYLNTRRPVVKLDEARSEFREFFGEGFIGDSLTSGLVNFVHGYTNGIFLPSVIVIVLLLAVVMVIAVAGCALGSVKAEDGLFRSFFAKIAPHARSYSVATSASIEKRVNSAREEASDKGAATVGIKEYKGTYRGVLFGSQVDTIGTWVRNVIGTMLFCFVRCKNISRKFLFPMLAVSVHYKLHISALSAFAAAVVALAFYSAFGRFGLAFENLLN